MTPVGPGWTEENARLARERFVAEQLAKGTNEGLGYAIHAVQDEASGSHGWQPYNGDVSTGHFIKDTFPSNYRFNLARRNTIDLLRNVGKCTCDN